MLTGEPGIGKTRAIEVLEREAVAAGVTVAWGYCREAGDTPPLWPFAQLARGLLARFPIALLRPRLGPAATELQRLLPELVDESAEKARGQSKTFVSYDPGVKHRIFDAITRLLILVAEHTPCVLMLDDLHRADAASLELLNYLIDEIARTRILLLGTVRKSEDAQTVRSAGHLTRVLGHRNSERIALDRLEKADVVSYVAALLDDPDGTLGRAVFQKSEGNPFFMVELSRRLRDAERADAGMLAVPDAALELVRQRICGLDEDARAVLSCAAVIGRSFELATLQIVSSCDSNTLMASLDYAQVRDVIKVAHDSRTTFSFGHELLRVVLYEALAPAERRRLHLRVGEALEGRTQAGDAVLPAELAYHFHAALPDGDLAKTVQHCARAAGAATRVHANADVLRYARHALEALDLQPQPSAELRLRLLMLQALYARVYSSTEFENAIQKAIAVAREQKDGVQLAQAALLLDPNPGFPPVLRAREALEDALSLLTEQQRGPRAAMLARLATTAPLAYDAQRSHEQIGRAFELGRDTDSLIAEYAACSARLYIFGGPARPEIRDEALEELKRLCREHTLSLAITPALVELHQAIVALQDGELRVMCSALERCRLHCRHVDHRELLWHVERCRVVSRINTGRFRESVSELQTLHRSAERHRILGTELFCAYDRSVILQTSLPQSADSARPILALDSDGPPSIWSMRVRALQAAGLYDQARAALGAVSVAGLAKLPCDRDYLGTLGALARSALALGALEHAAALYELLAPYPRHFAAHSSFFCEGSVSQLLGLLAQALGRPTDAREHLEAGIEISVHAGLALCTVQARFELARFLRSRGCAAERARARALERDAFDEARRIGLPRLDSPNP